MTDYLLPSQGDPRVDNYFLMHSPTEPLIITFLYLVFVLRIGPLLMKKREPFKLTMLMTIYNATQIISNGYLLLLGFTIVPRLSIWCSPPIKSNSSFDLYSVRAHYLFNILKLCDFMETVIYVLRKKEKQISFLHVFHHIGIYLFSWYSCKYFPGGQPIYSATLNTFIHLVMYVYYLTSSWIDAKYLWWKKYITSMQIIQHYLIILLFGIPLVNPTCSYPKLFLLVHLIFMVVMIYLFKKFYQKSYTAKNKKIEQLKEN